MFTLEPLASSKSIANTQRLLNYILQSLIC
nr:MAG TPA: hypothetical protein [Caudoviricetes sp.]